MELLPRSSEATARATAEAARRAGAGEIVEGEVGVAAGGLVLTLRRVGLGDGVVLHGYTVRAADPYALTDSATAAIVSDLELEPPAARVASAGTGSAIAYALYEQGLRSYYQGDLPSASRLMSATLDRDSSFAMAAFFGWLSNRAMGRLEEERRVLPLLRRLAASAANRDRLWIEGTIAQGESPAVELLRIAREMTDRFPADPDGQILLGTALAAVGDWAGSVDAFNRAIAIDSVAGVVDAPHCRVCSAIGGLGISYLWWDSIPAAERTANRLLAFRPAEGASWAALIEPMLRQGRRAEAEAAIARADKLSAVKGNFQPWLDRDLIRWGRSAELEARLLYELGTTPPDLRGEGPWLLALSLRNQGRLRDAQGLAAEGVLPGIHPRLDGHRDIVTLAIVAFEQGRPAESARRFLDMLGDDRASDRPIGPRSRAMAWHMALGATALAAAGDTAAVRALADSVERIGRSSNTGRDLRLHHFVRGLLLQQQNRHADAVEAFRRSLFSVTDGYTRTNLEMARSLTAVRRHAEAIAILQAALRGGVDGSNTYVTHTELHEALAHAFHTAGRRDSAAVHYAVVERAWRRADPEFADRYRTAKARATTSR
jgi:tetratricopeptide (TPR) repeat protein